MNKVDLYETLVVLVLNSSSEFEAKMAFLFKLYDFDNSNTVNI
jgi:hypothetical protein